MAETVLESDPREDVEMVGTTVDPEPILIDETARMTYMPEPQQEDEEEPIIKVFKHEPKKNKLIKMMEKKVQKVGKKKNKKKTQEVASLS